MERKELDSILEDEHYLEGGTREACVKAKEFLSNVINPGNQLHAPLSCVKADEFVEAVKVLINFSSRRKDTIPIAENEEAPDTMHEEAMLITYKKLATINNLNVEKIATLTGYSQSYIKKINKKERPLTTKTIEKLLVIFELDETKWNKIVAEVKNQLKKGYDENSIEVWYAIVKCLRDFSYKHKG